MTEHNKYPVSDDEKREEEANESTVFWTVCAGLGLYVASLNPTVSDYFKENQNIIMGAAGTIMGAAMGVFGYRIYQATRNQNPQP
jgi:hypothetical protein